MLGVGDAHLFAAVVEDLHGFVDVFPEFV